MILISDLLHKSLYVNAHQNNKLHKKIKINPIFYRVSFLSLNIFKYFVNYNIYC